MKSLQMLGFILIALGIFIPLGYIAKAYFTWELIPLPFRIAGGITILGIILILVSVGYERYKMARKEKFEEVER